MTAAAGRHGVVLVTLEGLVPVFQLEMRGWTSEQRRASVDVEAVIMSDGMMFGSGNGKKQTAAEHAESAKSLTEIARGLAVLSFQSGGVTFAGLHWCVEPHCECPTWPRAVCPAPCRDGCLLRTAAEGEATAP